MMVVIGRISGLNPMDQNHDWGTKHRAHRKVGPFVCLKFEFLCSIQAAYLTSRCGVTRCGACRTVCCGLVPRWPTQVHLTSSRAIGSQTLKFSQERAGCLTKRPFGNGRVHKSRGSPADLLPRQQTWPEAVAIGSQKSTQKSSSCAVSRGPVARSNYRTLRCRLELNSPGTME
jgi:hypothetical protein